MLQPYRRKLALITQRLQNIAAMSTPLYTTHLFLHRNAAPQRDSDFYSPGIGPHSPNCHSLVLLFVFVS